MPIEPLKWENESLILLDQTSLPESLDYIKCHTVEDIANSIENLVVRGAPAIGIAAAYGVVIGALETRRSTREKLNKHLQYTISRLSKTRPTAINLFAALDYMRKILHMHPDAQNDNICQLLLDAAHNLFDQERNSCRSMGSIGSELLPENARVITYCNTGYLATGDYGTALGVIYAARESGKSISVFACETRPLLQGARLTAWELQRSGVKVHVICDNMAASVLRNENITCCIVGADRIVANGDVANKIGTYGLAILAKEHSVPFYVVAPTSTIDLSLKNGNKIPIEQRDGDEIRNYHGKIITPAEVAVYNPSFDVTPKHLVNAIITEKGIARSPYNDVLRTWATESHIP